MKIVLQTFRETLKLIKSDRKVFFLSIFPALLALAFYIGVYFILGDSLIPQKYEESWWSWVLLFILMFLVWQYTFLFFISIISSPFLDKLSEYVEKVSLGKNYQLSWSLRRILSTVFNECKKIFVLIILAILSVLLGFIPLFIPLVMLIAPSLLAFQFLDYNYSRRGISFRDIRIDWRKNYFVYILGGAIFLIIASIPLLNTLLLPLGTIFFTLLWIKKNEVL